MRPSMELKLACIAAASLGSMPFDEINRGSLPSNGAYKSNARGCRTHTKTDQAAFMKRIKKRRAKKGYK
jgi:hypothetical protein